MADILSWEEKLSKHAIFKAYESKSEKNGNYQQHKSILAENDGQIFIWNNENGQIMTMNLKNLHFRNDRADRFQVFLCTSAPVFDVHSLLFSVAAKYIAIIGDHGITVLEVPQRWGKFAEYENGKDRINCRTIKADERFFTSHQSIKILDVKWHPGSLSDSHLVVLTSDNKLRIINILKPEAAEQVIPLGVPFSSNAEYTKNSISSTSAFAAALGETSVGFDFAPAINDLNQRNRKSESDLIHPVFVLRENGDVYYLLFRLYKECSNKELIGPLSIYPAADDNYGLDACSIVCLQSKPPVIVMATASGRLYHCVVLESWVGEENNEETVIQELPFGNKRRRSYEKSSLDLSLFVHECIELQSMPTENEESSAVDRAVSPASDDTECDNPLHITVLKDPVMTHHYHCSHLSGVHSITLPWMKKLEQFCTTDAESTDLFTSDEAAVVYHMICTSPRPLSHPAPVQGLAVVSDRLLGPALLCITQSMECIVKPLNVLERSLPLSLDNQRNIGKQNYQSPMKYLISSGSFLDFIKNILTRKMSTPLLKAGKSCADMSQQELYEIFVKEQHILRTEYIQKQSSAKEEIRKRSSMLQEQKDKQIEDLQNLDKEREELQQKAFDMADKLEDITEKNETLLKRIQKLFIEIQSGVPILSDSEKRMKEDLENIQQHMKFFKSSLQEVKTKTDWSTQKSKRTKSYNLPVVTGVQQERIREFIHQENEMIAEIVNQIKTLKLQVGV